MRTTTVVAPTYVSPRLEQEPLSHFRRDLALEDDLRILVEQLVARIVWRGRIQVAWLARRFR